MTRSKRSLRGEAIEALLHDTTVKIARRRDWELLEEIARIAQADAPLDMAMTDPAMFVTLRNAITRYHLKGWTRMTPERVRLVAADAQREQTQHAV